uniref:GATA zinc finger domain-containing protein 14-like n=1 Tax=Schistosoma mansoni TaxID=6183 RepID=A0A5K4EH50_SCHMA
MPRCRKGRKSPYRTDEIAQNVKSSFIRDGENNLRNYSQPVDDGMKQVFYRSVPENVMKEQIYGERLYRQLPNEGQNMNKYVDAYDRMKPSTVYNDMSNTARSYPKWNDYDRSRSINSYKVEDIPYNRNIRDGFEPRQTPLYSNNMMGELPVPRNTHTGYEPRHLSPYGSRSNNLMGDIPDAKLVRETYEPHYIPVKYNRSNNLLNVSETRNIRDRFESRQTPLYSNNMMGELPAPSSVSSNGNTYSYSIPQRPNLKIIRDEDTYNRYTD